MNKLSVSKSKIMYHRVIRIVTIELLFLSLVMENG